MLVNRQDFSLSIKPEDEKTYINQRDDFSWCASSLTFFEGLTYIGEANDPFSSWWLNRETGKAYRVRNTESSIKLNILEVCSLKEFKETPYTHVLCHLQDFEQKGE